MEWLAEAEANDSPEGQEFVISLARELVMNSRPELAEQVARAAWAVYGNEHATADLISTLVRTILTNGDIEAVVNFVQQELSSESDAFHELDRNSDGQITSSEVSNFWSTRHVTRIDENGDGIVTQDDTGEALWYFVSDADLNKDGSIVQTEYRRLSRLPFFTRLDVNGDGQISSEEIGQRAFFSRFDTNNDGTISEEEFFNTLPPERVGGRLGSFTQQLTPEEQFAQSDQDGDARVSMDEANEEFWASIAEFDTNEDNAIDLLEYEEGLQQRKLEKAERFFTNMDRNSDGQASQDEVPARLWERWRRFDSNGDQTLNRDEFMKSQTAKGTTNTEQ